MSFPQLSDNSKVKSFWERPEGTTGMLTMAVLGVGGFFLAQALLPSIIAVLGMAITAVGQGIVLAGLCAVLAAVLYILTNKKFLTLCQYAFKSVMRKVTGLFVEIDPIGIMKNYIDDLRGRQEEMDSGIEKLNGQIKICEAKVRQNATGYEKAMATAKVAQEKDMKGQFTVNARQAGRLERLNNETLIPLLKTMEINLRALRKYREVTDTVILDLSNEVEARKIERDMILASHSVITAAKRIMNGDPDKKELFDQAMEFVVQDYGMKLGEIENFIETSKTFVEGLDLQNGVYEEEALKKMQQWEQKADSILLGDNKRLMLEQATTNTVPFSTSGQRVPVTIDGDYSKFLK
jgi:hypothetical protein